MIKTKRAFKIFANSEVIQGIILVFFFIILLAIIGVGTYHETGNLSYLLKMIYGLILPFGVVIVILSFGLMRQIHGLNKINRELLQYAKINHLEFKILNYPVFDNPGEGGRVEGIYKTFTLSIQSYFHGYQLGRKSLLVEIEGIKSPSKLLFSSHKHPFPKIDFWNYTKIPSFSSFLCERGPLVKLKNPHVIELPEKIGKTHYLVAEKKEYADELISKKALENLIKLNGAVYLDGEKLYYGQRNLPKTEEEIGKIVDSLVELASILIKK